MRPSPIPKAPTERKVKAATIGAGGGAIWGSAVIELLDRYVIGRDTMGDVPQVLQLGIMLAAGAITAYVAGRRANHTARPDLPVTDR